MTSAHLFKLFLPVVFQFAVAFFLFLIDQAVHAHGIKLCKPILFSAIIILHIYFLIILLHVSLIKIIQKKHYIKLSFIDSFSDLALLYTVILFVLFIILSLLFLSLMFFGPSDVQLILS